MATLEKSETTKELLEAFKPFEHFSRAMLDGYVVVDMNAKAVKLNQLFAQLVGLKTKQVIKAESIDDIIKFYAGNKHVDLKEVIASPCPTRIDEVRGITQHNSDLNLIIGVYPFANEQNEPLGAFLLIRDVTAETNLQGKYAVAQNKSITDPLTGLFTRGYFEEYLDLQVESLGALPADSEKRSLTLVMVDIDFFKKVNDTYGHQAGDYILQRTAKVMNECFRNSDIICRYGGEEFLIILPNTNLIGAETAAEKLRESIQNEVIEFEDQTIPITISCGVAMLKLGRETYTETLSRADGCLYEAKRSGRNRVKVEKS